MTDLLSRINSAATTRKNELSTAIIRRANVNGNRIRLFLDNRKLDDSDRIDSLPSIAIHSHQFERIIFRANNETEANSLFDLIRSAMRQGINSRGQLMRIGNSYLDCGRIDEPGDYDMMDFAL